MITSKIRLDQDQIAAFCRKWRIAEMSLFGSVLRDDFGPDSDVDFLVTFEPGADHDWEAWPVMVDELAGIVGRPVDFVEQRLVEQSRNYIRRREILTTARRIYAA
jgi:predicted nucleotidyltransferase